jgi:hypothetical protein
VELAGLTGLLCERVAEDDLFRSWPVTSMSDLQMPKDSPLNS